MEQFIKNVLIGIRQWGIKQGSNNLTSNLVFSGEDSVSNLTIKDNHTDLIGVALHKNSASTFDRGIFYSFTPDKIVLQNASTNASGQVENVTSEYKQTTKNIEFAAEKVIVNPTSDFNVNGAMNVVDTHNPTKFDNSKIEAKVQDTFTIKDGSGKKIIETKSSQTKINNRLDVTEPERGNTLSLKKDGFETKVSGSNGISNWQKMTAGGNPFAFGVQDNDNINDGAKTAFLNTEQDGNIYVYGVDGYNGISTYRTRSLQTVISDLENNKQNVLETTVSELRDMRDNGELTPGCKYRITDYECKVEGMISSAYAKSENNKYDIVVEAIDEHTLSQDAKAMNHVPEEPEHEVTEITKFKFFSDMGNGEESSIYGFMIRNKSIDGTNTSTDERMADCQVGWSIIAESFQRQFDSASTFDDVTSWEPYIPDTIKIFTLNSDIMPGDTAYTDATDIDGSGVIEVSILDTLEETHTEGGDYFKNCNLDAWELKYSLDLDDKRFEWISTKDGIVTSMEGLRITLSRDETYDMYGKWVVNIPIEGTSYRFAYNGQGGEEESDVTYYTYGLLGEVELPEGYTGVIKFTTEFPVVGDNGYFVMSDESLQPFTFTSEMLSTKNTAWTTTMFGQMVCALTEESPQVGELCNIFTAYQGEVGFIPYQSKILEIKDASSYSYKGVVYYMKDEWNNECPYDFKNIKFGRNEFTNSSYPDLCYGNENNTFNFLYDGNINNLYLSYFYTFAVKDLASRNWYDASVAASIGLKDGVNSMVICRDNKIKPTCKTDVTPLNVQCLNGNVFFNVFEDLSNVSTVSDESLACRCINNTIEGMEASFGTFGASAFGNKVSGSKFMFGNNAMNNVKAFSTNSTDEELHYGNSTQNILPPSTNIFTNFWKGTQAEYDAIGSHDSNTLYIITEN